MRTVGQRGWGRTLGLWLLLAGWPAAAWPVDVRLTLAETETRTVELTSLDWVESDAPEVVSARRLASGALELAARRPGQARLLLYAEGGFAVWRVVVGEGPERPEVSSALREAAARACPGLEVSAAGGPRSSGGPRLQATVPDEACRLALLPLLASDAFLARDLSLTFSSEALQAQLIAIQRTLQREKLPVRATYVAAGLVLRGELTAAEHRRALWIAFEHSAGKVAFEDRIQVASAAGDGVQQDAPPSDPVEVVPLKTVREEQPRARKAQQKGAPKQGATGSGPKAP